VASITLRAVSKSYDGKTDALAPIDLAIADGEFVTLVGPSGCGKSTLLSLVAGLEQPTGGVLEIDGQRVNERSPKERDLAMVFQSYALYPHMTVARNIAFPLEIANVPKNERETRVRETAKRLGIEELLGRKPAELSGGQRQRVALGRALVRRPKAYLFDEPLSNLDAALRARMRAELKKLHEELRATFVYVTHDQAEAMTLSDRVVVLHQGKARQIGTPREVYERPADTTVARFLGSPMINLFPATLIGETSDVTIGVRPEHVTLAAQEGTQEGAPEGEGAGHVSGSVYVVEPMGAESFVTVDVERGIQITARAPADVAVRPGDRVHLAWEPSRLLRFDARGALCRVLQKSASQLLPSR
jgi:multiple sugar transport system ATP-binding protein